MTREAPRRNRLVHGVVVILTLLTVSGFVLLFLLLVNTEKQGLLVALPFVGAVVLARMIAERRRLARVHLGVPVVTGGLMLAVSLLLPAFPQSTPVEQVLGGGILSLNFGADEGELDSLDLTGSPLYCSDGRCLIPDWQMKVNDITGTNQRNVLKNAVDITVIWPDGDRRTVLSKDVNFSSQDVLTYRFNRHVPAGEALMPGVYIFVVKRADGSEIRLYTEHKGEVIDIPADVDISRQGDSLRVAWKQQLPSQGVTWYRVGISPIEVNPVKGPVFGPDPDLLYFEELTGPDHLDVGEENVLEIVNPGFVEGERYNFVFFAQVDTEYLSDVYSFTW